MKKNLNCLLAILILFVLNGCSKEPSNNNTVDANKQEIGNTKKDKFELSSKQTNVLRWLMQDEIEIFIKGGDVNYPKLLEELTGVYVVTSAKELQKEYERNEVAADVKFRKKLLIVNGVVKSIDRSVGENYFISLKGGSNPFMQPKAAMADGYIDYMAQLEKGNSINLICLGNGMLIGSAMLANCQPSKQYSLGLANDYINKFSSEQVLSSKNSYSTKILLGSIAIASLLPDNSSCNSVEVDSKKCGDEFKIVTKDKNEFIKALKIALISLNVPTESYNSD